MGPQKHYFSRQFGASKIALTKARFLKHVFPVRGPSRMSQIVKRPYQSAGAWPLILSDPRSLRQRSGSTRPSSPFPPELTEEPHARDFADKLGHCSSETLEFSEERPCPSFPCFFFFSVKDKENLQKLKGCSCCRTRKIP